MSAHTPGPWVADGCHVVAARWRVAFCDNDVNSAWSHGDTGCPIEPIESRANARLIAAAPELLEALKAFAEPGQNLDQAKCHAGIVDSIHCVRCSKVFVARAAIAKAVGE